MDDVGQQINEWAIYRATLILQKDVREIRISTDKIVKKGEIIDNLHFEDDIPASDLEPGSPTRNFIQRRALTSRSLLSCSPIPFPWSR